MRYIVLVLLLIAGGCSYSNSNAGNGEVRLKNITIQINDHQNNEQKYTIQI